MAHNIGWETSSNKDLFKKVIRQLFDNTDREALVEYKKLVNDQTSDDEFERDTRMAGLSGHTSLSDGQNIPIQDATRGGDITYTQSRYGTGFRITKGMKKFNKWGLMEKLTRNLGKAMREAKDKEIFKMFNNLTATTYVTTYDGKAIANASHDNLDGSTYDNQEGNALSFSSLQSARIYFDTLVDDNGDEIVAEPDLLVVESNLRYTAQELLESELRPHEQSNTTNVAQGYGLTPYVSKRMSANTDWFVVATGDSNYDVNVFTSQEPDVVVKDAPDTSLDTVVVADQWFTYGCGDPRLVYNGNV